jgi:hypothetical protein
MPHLCVFCKSGPRYSLPQEDFDFDEVADGPRLQVIRIWGACDLSTRCSHSQPYDRRRRRSGAKVQIGCNDLQGADLSRRLLHGSMPKPSPIRLGFDGNNVLRDHKMKTCLPYREP